MLRTGTEAPDFTAALDSGGALTLSDLRGQNVVLYFYPRASVHARLHDSSHKASALRSPR